MFGRTGVTNCGSWKSSASFEFLSLNRLPYVAVLVVHYIFLLLFELRGAAPNQPTSVPERTTGPLVTAVRRDRAGLVIHRDKASLVSA